MHGVARVNLLVLLTVSLFCFTDSKSQVYYITPNDGDCTENGTKLSPCYTLNQLNESDVLSPSRDDSVKLLLLSGTHLLAKGKVLTISGFREVSITPWNEQQDVVIQCQSDKKNQEMDFDFKDIVELDLSSLHFYSCSLHYEIKSGSVNISKCVFERSSKNCAIHTTFAEIKVKLNLTISKCMFLSNRAGAMRILRNIGISTCVYVNITDTLFQDNHVHVFDGDSRPFALSTTDSLLIISNSQFVNNSRAILAEFSSLMLDNITFYKNNGSGFYVDSSFFLSYTNANVKNSQFVENSGGHGAAIGIKSSCETLRTTINNCTFQGNQASSEGGAISVEGNARLVITNSLFENNSAASGGALHIKDGDAWIGVYDSIFTLNNAENDGGAIYCKGSNTLGVRLEGSGYSLSNTANSGSGGFAFLSNCNLYLLIDSISNNSALNGGAIYAKSGSWIHTDNNFILSNNFAGENGGALYLSNSTISTQKTITFDSNVAIHQGGAIFVPNKNCDEITECFFIRDYWEQKYFIFSNNNASEGSVVYGGLLDRCVHLKPHGLGIDRFKIVAQYEPTPLAITSDPIRLCLCGENFTPNCTKRETNITKMSGQAIDLIGAVVDQNSKPRASFIRADNSGLLGRGDASKATGTECSKLSYHIFTNKTSATLVLRPKGACEQSNFSSITVYITLMCSRGFEELNSRCVCDKRLTEQFSITCDVDSGSIKRKRSIWLVYDKYHLKLHTDCPLGYCQDAAGTINFTDPDEQCANNRSGVICGACRNNHYITLGGSKCLPCTSSYKHVLWLIPLFAVAGMALVALLLVCNMTVSHGTLNGLLFYANVISVTRLTSLQTCTIHPVLSVFIAWLNLDFGVETCFYSGMDTYQKTWLQFVFPLYIWLLVGAIILITRFSSTAVKVIGMNSVSILATLFLLSYTKILKTIITALNFTQVFQGSANDTSDPLMPYNVWTYDGNVEYLVGKHIPLFVVASMFLVFLFLPYTLLLIFGQCIRSLPTRRRVFLFCIRSTAFISIMDAYHAPYNNKHRYWTGLMLLVRCVLFLAFAFTYKDSELLENMYITTLILIGIFSLKIFFTKVYKSFFVNSLEVSFLLNLIILSVTLRNESDSGKCALTSASISVSMLTFFGILIYHAYLQLNKIQRFTSIKNTIVAKWKARIVPENTHPPLLPANHVQRLPTTSTVELREELLEDVQNVV